MKLSVRDGYNMISAWEERLVEFKMIRNKVGVEWDPEAKVIGKVTVLKGNADSEEDINSNKSVIEKKVIESAISTSPLWDCKQDTLAEEKCKRVM